MASKSNGLSSTTSSEDIAKQIAALQADISALTETVGDYGKTKAAELQGAAKEKSAELRAKGEQHLESAKDHAAELNAQANDFIAQKPAMALGVAAGIGFLVGMLSTRR